MSRLLVRELHDDDVAAAAGLLSEHVHRLRMVEPLLPLSYERVGHATTALHGLLGAGGATAAVARRGDVLAGFLVGAPRAGFPGPNVWVSADGSAYDDPAVLAALYAFLAKQWVDVGLTAHYALVPSCDTTAVETWFRLVFGLQHVHAATELDATVSSAAPPPDLRRASTGDVGALVDFERQLTEHLGRSPVLSPVQPDDPEELRQEWLRTLETDDEPTFVVEREGIVVAAAIGCPVTRSSAHAGLARQDDAAMLAWVVVDEQHRGQGLSRPLARAVLDWARGCGYRSIVTDWRSANLESARAWRRLGFRDTFYRLHRNVGW
jgi:RimJ/RimL family protein N-acetyltransferase